MHHKSLHLLLSFLAGALLTCAFAPINYPLAAFVSLCSFFYLLNIAQNLKRKTLLGYVYGIGFFATSVSWVYVSISTFSQSSTLGILLTALFIIILSLFFIIFVLLSAIAKTPIQRMLIYPVAWGVIELARTKLFTGFPWVLLGYTQTDSFLASYASIGGVYLVSFIVCLISVCLSEILLQFKQFKNQRIQRINKTTLILSITLAVIPIIAGIFINKITWTHPVGKSKTVRIIQGNYVEYQKWDPTRLQHIMRYYYQVTRNNPADLIFWSENSIPTFKPYITSYLKAVDEMAKAQDSAVLVGTVDVNAKSQYFNSAFVYGNGYGHYYKHHLVPFGEYYPFEYLLSPFMQYFNIPMSSFTKGQEIQPLLDMDGVLVALFICYESAYPFEVRAQLQNAHLIAIISDDAWFGNSLAPWQHAQIAQMRAIETGRFVVQSTNNGVSLIINPKGQVIAQLPRNKQSILSGKITPMAGQTFWMQYGIYPFVFISLLFIILSLLSGSPIFAKAKPEVYTNSTNIQQE
ncbi:apolipoprotein N-acyltransferase [Facilibium subflavum]|uniref:apolipoprotein N-acyltransferase n=1 Tax=Facilibium subflavum TaxID=2219058 RepID=UPI000E64FB57|nr:apolipoprotein N-acyltransferase [Facilibium subflavum]